jgi:hypothetical protein
MDTYPLPYHACGPPMAKEESSIKSLKEHLFATITIYMYHLSNLIVWITHLYMAFPDFGMILKTIKLKQFPTKMNLILN